MVFNSKSSAETQRHAREFAALCPPGMVIRLHGTLGAGKTTWVQGFVSGMGAEGEATSPSFSLLHEYRGGRLDIFHWDLYRLERDTDWSVLDLGDHLPSAGITLIEWPERYPGPWPGQKVVDVFIVPHDDESRSLKITSSEASKPQMTNPKLSP